MVITGTRAEFGLLRSVIEAVQAHSTLDLQLVVTGTHLLPPAHTVNEVTSAFPVAATIEAQRANEHGRLADVAALGRLIAGLQREFDRLQPDVLVVLGDRLEAFGAASAASLAGIRVAHLHGGDRAEGVADEAMRHAISKLAHLHFPATRASAERLMCMGEDRNRIHIVGSPALDDLGMSPALSDKPFAALGSPDLLILHHPTGEADQVEASRMTTLLEAAKACGAVLALHPNHDPGRSGTLRAIEQSGVHAIAHLPRPTFLGLLRRVKSLVGNSSAGLIECAAIGLSVVNVGSRQAGRERAANVIDVPEFEPTALRSAIRTAMGRGHTNIEHPYGDGRTGARVADHLASFDPTAITIRKLNTY